ncbi:MAG: hypothetical protein E7287_09095 [Lachnospiraceae bacterium]|nr:hypothetical protein [Lachnospiraceae bacterium]
MLFYTWKDVDRFIQMKRAKWAEWALDIEVYASEMVISLRDMSDISKAQSGLRDLFGTKMENNRICLDMHGQIIEVVYEQAEVETKRAIVPLFKNILYQEDAYTDNIQQELAGVPVMVFHSYKGGVGRTLSLLAFSKAWAEEREDKSLLIVDADIEAPGITWMVQHDEEGLSYLDLLEIIQCGHNVDDIVEQAVEKVGSVSFNVDTETRTVEHLVLPTYRYDEQVLDMYSSPENIVNGYNKKYILAEVLSKLGERLGVAAVLVDLRAGLSEFSAPLLFDPRVKKYIVSSTSYQSVKGTELLLRQLNKGLAASVEANLPEIFLTMSQSDEEIPEISSRLQAAYNGNNEDGFMDNIITELPFASELIRVDSLQQIMSVLTERIFYKNIRTLIRNNYSVEEKVVMPNVASREECVSQIHKLAETQLVAETNVEFNVLMTSALKNLIKKYVLEVPATVVMGAKGAGKTFLYKEMLKNKYWEAFSSSVQNSASSNNICQTVLIPLLASKNSGDISAVLNSAIEEANRNIHGLNLDIAQWQENEKRIKLYMKEEHESFEWEDFWKTLFLFGMKNVNSLDELERVLSKENKRIVFLVDGLEEIFENTLTNQNEKNAVVGLARDTINALRAKYKNIGCLVFLRQDVARNAIDVNYTQFENLYKNYELNWSKTEALRLALWLVHQAVPGFYTESVDIAQASAEAIENYLVKLWGRKLGKPNSNEANSSRWILAALSDFNGQLQARDIIRFLKYATSDAGKTVYDDRYIMPNEIRKAVPNCSEEKIGEVKQEIGALKPIFERLSSAHEDKRILPFESGTFDLSTKEEQIMKQEGYLRIDNGKYYLPEIIRHALKFKYGRGARPKVLSLIFEK